MALLGRVDTRNSVPAPTGRYKRPLHIRRSGRLRVKGPQADSNPPFGCDRLWLCHSR